MNSSMSALGWPLRALFAVLNFPLLCSGQDNSSSGSGASATVIAALGTIIGYIGSEAADDALFERLLWPERYYNNISPTAIVIFAVFFPMGGPLHAAAIHTLISLRDNNLYRGTRQGDMLGTPFFTDLKIKYFARSNKSEFNVAKQARNALLIRILRLVNPRALCKSTRQLFPDDSGSHPETIRTTSYVQHLRLRYATERDLVEKKYVHITDTFSWKTIVGLISSEVTGIILALVVGFRLGSWFGFWWLAPLFLKLAGALFRVRRQSLIQRKDGQSPTCMFEVEGNDRWFFLIEGPDEVVRQFFRHYGHPKRDTPGVIVSDRLNEVVSIAIVVLYGTIFPVGLLAVTLWLDIRVQFVWLGYQLWTSLVILICRLLDGNSWGTTEESIASALTAGKHVVFAKEIVLTLDVTALSKVDMARSKIQELLENHARQNIASQEAQ